MIKILTLLLSVSILASCSKSYLDVSDELAEELTMEKIFSNPADVKRFHRNIYSGIPNTGEYAREFGGLYLPWPQLTDELERGQIARPLNITPYNASHSDYGRWRLYQQIRQANIFLERAVEIPRQGRADFIDAAEIAALKAQARFLRAYYHYLLFELYGPITIMTELADPEDRNVDYARNSVDEVVDFIYNELTEVAAQLEDSDLSNQEELAVPTKGAALALRGRLMIYAASPLFNGGYTEALSLTNPDGKRLFPDADPSKWQRALSALQEFIDYAESGHYELYKAYTGTEYDPDKSLYELFMSYNKEIIFARSNVLWGTVPQNGVDGWSIPRGARGGTSQTGYIAVIQELVDDFFMIDGLDIDESTLYQEEGYSNVNTDPSGRTEPGTRMMYVKREPRFYQTVFYNERKWHVGGETIQFNKGGNSDNSETNNYATTGYILYKRLSQRVYDEGNNPRSEYRPAIIFRLAEFYLLYAEALNEVNPGDSRILEFVDKVRERAGIPKLVDIKPEIVGNQEAQREAIRREMRVELATEGQRYFDVRRWMIAENPSDEGGQGGPIHGMDMNAPTVDGFYQRTVIENRAFRKAMYLYPLPLEEIQNSQFLVQNPGYQK